MTSATRILKGTEYTSYPGIKRTIDKASGRVRYRVGRATRRLSRRETGAPRPNRVGLLPLTKNAITSYSGIGLRRNWYRWKADSIIYNLELPQGDVLYGYRIDGPRNWHEGHRFDNSIILIDPYAKLIEGRRAFGDNSSKMCRFLGTYDFNSLPFDWGENYKLPNILERAAVAFKSPRVSVFPNGPPYYCRDNSPSLFVSGTTTLKSPAI
ncbi:hypothetical protein FXO37_17235 [Capsicum annuum]|nr:hypothetical protein FXO37_17235 [Capsicum annuum]